MFTKYLFALSFFIVIFSITRGAVCPTNYNATPPSNYCYQRRPQPSSFSYEIFTQICTIGGATLPYFPNQAVYANFLKFWQTYADLPTVMLSYQHKDGYASFSDIVSTLDDQQIGWGNPFQPGEPSNGFSESCVEMWNVGQWNDVPCSSNTLHPICQTMAILDDTFVTTPCSPLCQATSSTSGRLFSTSLLRCQQFGTVDTTTIGYAMTVPISSTTETVYEMRDSTTGKSIMQYGQTAAQNAINLNYSVQRAFFVATSIIATQTALYTLFRNSSNKIDSETQIVLKNSTTYLTLVSQSWTEEASFYLFTQMTSYSCSMALDCTWGQWTQWSQCTVSCDGGIQTRNRVKSINEARGGICDNIYDGNQTCNSQFCLLSSPSGVALMNASGLTDALADAASLALTIEDSVPYMMSSMTTDEKKQLGFQPSDNIIKCIYDQKQCNSTRDFKLIYDPSMGNCFTFNYPIDSLYTARRAGDSNDDYLCSTTRAGFRVLLHDPTLSPFVDNIGVQIRPGYLTSLFVSQVKTKMQPPPYGSCYSGENNIRHPYYYEGNYSTEGCIRSCFQASVIKSCGCGDPRFPVPTNTAYCDVSQKRCIEKLSNCEDQMNRASCNCPTSCAETQYFSIITNARLYNSPMLVDHCSGQNDEALDDCIEHARKDFAVLEISFQTLKTINYEENSAYSLIQLFNDASNVAGLLLGIGMMTIPEVLILFYNFCFAVCCRLFLSRIKQ